MRYEYRFNLVPYSSFPFPTPEGYQVSSNSRTREGNEAGREADVSGLPGKETKGSMRYDRFAERAAERLEAVATAIEDEDRRARGATSLVRANEMRVAAFMVKDMAEALKREENLLAEACDGDNETTSGIDHAKEAVKLEKELVLF